MERVDHNGRTAAIPARPRCRLQAGSTARLRCGGWVVRGGGRERDVAAAKHLSRDGGLAGLFVSQQQAPVARSHVPLAARLILGKGAGAGVGWGGNARGEDEVGASLAQGRLVGGRSRWKRCMRLCKAHRTVRPTDDGHTIGRGQTATAAATTTHGVGGRRTAAAGGQGPTAVHLTH